MLNRSLGLLPRTYSVNERQHLFSQWFAAVDLDLALFSSCHRPMAPLARGNSVGTDRECASSARIFQRDDTMCTKHVKPGRFLGIEPAYFNMCGTIS